jgi:hypothetical protein
VLVYNTEVTAPVWSPENHAADTEAMENSADSSR